MRHPNVLIFLVFLLFAARPAPADGTVLAQQDPPDLSGTYSNGQLTVTLERAATGYTGRFDAAGNVAELAGSQGRDGVVTGSYDFNGRTFQFQAAAVPGMDALVFQAEGRRFVLQRQADAEAAGPAASSGDTGVEEPSDEPGRPDADAGGPSPDPEEAVTDASSSGASDTVRNEEWGLELPVPDGWIAREVEGGQAYLLGWPGREGFILLMPLQTAELDQLRAEMRQGVEEGDGTSLRPTGTIESFGDDGLAVDVEGTLEGQQVRAHVVARVSPHGQGASVLVAAAPDAFESAHREDARELTRSLGFFQPEVPPEVAEWRQRLRGRVLTQFDSYSSGAGGGGYTSRTEIDLCVAGHFHYSGSHQASFNTSQPTSGYVMGDRRGAGTWEVVARGGEPALRLEFHDGEVWEYALGWGDEIPASSSRYTSLDGSDYHRTPSKKAGCGR